MNIALTAVVGAGGGFLVLREPLGWTHLVALGLLAVGVLFLGHADRPTDPAPPAVVP